MDCGSQIYTSASICKDELIEVKTSMFAEMIYYLNYFNLYFSNNKYFDKVVEYISSYYKIFLEELNREHDIYDSIMEYLATFEYLTDLEDEDIIDDLNSIFDQLDEATEYRIMFYAQFLNHLDDVLASGTLTSSNYLFYNYVNVLSEEKSEKIKRLIPGGGNV